MAIQIIAQLAFRCMYRHIVPPQKTKQFFQFVLAAGKLRQAGDDYNIHLTFANSPPHGGQPWFAQSVIPNSLFGFYISRAAHNLITRIAGLCHEFTLLPVPDAGIGAVCIVEPGAWMEQRIVAIAITPDTCWQILAFHCHASSS